MIVGTEDYDWLELEKASQCVVIIPCKVQDKLVFTFLTGFTFNKYQFI